MLKNLGMSVFLCNFARYLLNTRYVCTARVNMVQSLRNQIIKNHNK